MLYGSADSTTIGSVPVYSAALEQEGSVRSGLPAAVGRRATAGFRGAARVKYTRRAQITPVAMTFSETVVA